MKKMDYPAFWHYTTLDALNRLIPQGISPEIVITKELLDNACDAAEKYDGTVSISFESKRLKISNNGTITTTEIKKVTDFSRLISEKYSKKAYTRGQIGHGLKIAFMLAITEKDNIYINSGGYHHSISLIDRQSKDPRQVLKTDSSKCQPDNKTTIDVPIRNNGDKIKEYIYKYITLNPHIEFKFNSNIYYRATDLKKSDRADIFSYSEKTFKEFMKSYLAAGFSLKDFIEIFNVKKNKIQTILRANLKSVQKIFWVIYKFSKKLSPPVLGREAIAERMEEIWGGEIIDYKKLSLGNGVLEFALFGGDDYFAVCGINGSCLSDRLISIPYKSHGQDLLGPLVNVAADLKFTKPLFFSFYSTTPELQDSNKQTVVINNERVYKALKKLYKKHFDDRLSSKDWLLKKRSYKSMISDDPELASDAHDYNVNSVTYCFLLDCKEISEAMFEKYGPITLRQLYYQLVTKNIIKNSASSYSNFINHMVSGRENGLIEYELFEDRSRYTVFPQVVSAEIDPGYYARERLKESLAMPEIDLWEKQPYYVELWIEKDALFSLFEPIAKEKQIPLFPSRGYTSLTKIQEARNRFIEKINMGKKVIILCAGDLDPSGWDIYQNICNKFWDNKKISIERFALEPIQTSSLSPMPIKESDSRFKAFLEKHSEIEGAYELDAMDPDTLRQLTATNIEKYFNENLIPARKIKVWKQKFSNFKNSFFEKIHLRLTFSFFGFFKNSCYAFQT